MWLGLLFPYFGIAFGLAFMMCDDPRRREVGRICILWSLVSTVLHVIVMFLAVNGMREYIQAFIGGMQKAGGGMGGGGLGGGLE